jgi:excisionase family DNA binding protein
MNQHIEPMNVSNAVFELLRDAAEETAVEPSAVDERLAVPDDVLDVPHVASLLRVGRSTIYALVAKNQIPHRRLGRAIRFSRASVMSWLSTSWQVAKEGR